MKSRTVLSAGKNTFYPPTFKLLDKLQEQDQKDRALKRAHGQFEFVCIKCSCLWKWMNWNLRENWKTDGVRQQIG